jgi:hypothetical protein
MESLPYDLLRKIYELLAPAYRAALMRALPAITQARCVGAGPKLHSRLRALCTDTVFDLVIRHRAMITGPAVYDALFDMQCEEVNVDVLFIHERAQIYTNGRNSSAILQSRDNGVLLAIQRYSRFREGLVNAGFVVEYQWAASAPSADAYTCVNTRYTSEYTDTHINVTFTNVNKYIYAQNYWFRPYRLIYSGRLTLATPIHVLLRHDTDETLSWSTASGKPATYPPTSRFRDKNMRSTALSYIIVPTANADTYE